MTEQTTQTTIQPVVVESKQLSPKDITGAIKELQQTVVEVTESRVNTVEQSADARIQAAAELVKEKVNNKELDFIHQVENLKRDHEQAIKDMKLECENNQKETEELAQKRIDKAEKELQEYKDKYQAKVSEVEAQHKKQYTQEKKDFERKLERLEAERYLEHKTRWIEFVQYYLEPKVKEMFTFPHTGKRTDYLNSLKNVTTLIENLPVNK